MSKLRRGRVQVLVVALWLGAFLLLSCQPAQPVVTPQPAEKAAATAKPAEKATEKPAATATKPAATPVAAATKPAEKAAEKPVRGGTLRLSNTVDPPSLDPQVTPGQPPFPNITDLLVQTDKDGNLSKEGLFKDWTISGDGKSITFKLQGGVKFHDGTDLDAAAVKWNIERIKDPATKSPNRTFFDAVASLDLVDSLTIRFNLKQADPLLLARMSTWGSMVVSPAAVQKLGQDFGRKAVGSGPFQFVEWVPGDHVTLKRFEGYWKKDQAGNQLPYLDGVVYKIIPDVDVALANLRTGQIDVYQPSIGAVPPAQLPVIKADANLTYSLEALPYMRGIYLNTVKPPFDNKALRQAVALALDREGIGSIFGKELAAPHASILHPAQWAYDGKAGVFPARDLAKAKAKMAEAGYPSGGLKVKYTSMSAFLTEAQVVKANLAEIGIDMEIESLATAAWATKVSVVGGDYQISAMSLSIGLPDAGHIFGSFFHSQGSRNAFGPYSNPQVDQLMDKAGSIYDQGERAALYRQAAQILADDVPAVLFYVNNMITPMSKKVRDYHLGLTLTIGLGRTWLAK